MSQNEHTWARWIIAIFMCSLPLAGGVAFSYFNPLTVVRLERAETSAAGNDETAMRVDVVLSPKLLLFIPRGEVVISNVTKIDYAALSSYTGEVTFHGDDGPANVLSGSKGKLQTEQLNRFLSDRSQTSATVRLAPALVPVVFLAGIGGLLVGAILLGSLGRVLWFANVLPAATAGVEESELPPEIAKSLKRGLALTTIVAWKPGRQIFFRRRIAVSAYLFTFGFAAVIGGVVGAWLFELTGALIAGIVLGLVACSYLATKAPSRSVLIDWEDGFVMIREGWSRVRRSLSDVDGLKIELLFTKRSEGGESKRKFLEYRSQLNICFGSREAMLLDTDDWRKDKEAAGQDMSELAKTLSTHLQVPVADGGEARDPSFFSELCRRPFSVPSVFMAATAAALIWLVAMAGWGYYQHGAAKAAIRKAGGEVTNLNSKGIAKWTVLTNGKGVTFKTPIDNDKLAQISDELRRLQRLDLNLSQCSITDEGLRNLSEAENILSLNLSQTAITDEGLTTIASLKSLVELQLSGCAISDEGLERLQALPNLRFLGLTRTPITDAGLRHLQKLKHLNRVTIGWGSVTPAGARLLRELLPRTEVLRVGPPYESKKSADEVTAANGKPLPADGGPPLALVRRYLVAVAKNDKDGIRAAFSKTVQLTFASEESGWRALRPVEVGVFSGFVRGDHATVEVNGRRAGGSGATFKYQLIREDGEWKIVRGQMQ